MASNEVESAPKPNFIVPIKAEFLYKNGQPRYNLESGDGDKISEPEKPKEKSDTTKTDNEKVENDAGNDEPAKKKPKLRGQNKNRPREKRIDTKLQLCFSILNDKTCPFGEKCKFLHDKNQFWSKKPPDLGEKCPIFEKFGFCKYGLTCRFAKSHLDENLNNINRLKNGENSQNSAEIVENQPTNCIDFEIKRKLQKRTYDFSLSNQYLSKLQHKNPKNSTKNDGIVSKSDEISAKNNEIAPKNDEISAKNGEIAPKNDEIVEKISEKQVENDEKAVILEKRVLKKLTTDDFRQKLFLAPLTTVGNLPYRRVCVNFGAEITCGEMAMATELLQASQSEWALVRRHESEKFFGVQLCGSHADTMTKCTQLLVENCQLDFIDLNMGCPIDLICQKGAGCMLMHRTRRLEEIVNGVQSVMGDVALTLKMRTGVYGGKNIAHNLMPNLNDWGISAVTIHGRSREQRYTKSADWDYVNLCAQAAKPVPLFGCGDVLTFEDYYRNLDTYPDLAGCVLARGALIKPWLFTEIKERRHWDISSSERLDILKTYVNYGLEHWGSDQRGVDTTRRFLLEWLSFLYRYVPVGLLERVPQKINERPPPYFGRDHLETLMASSNCKDWIKISELLLGPVSDDFQFLPKHKANSYQG